MNWEAMGAIAELTAALGVIVSLVYLARQISANSDNISQNTKVLLSNTDMNSNQTALELYGAQAGNRELAELTLKGHLNFEALNPLEQYQYGFAILSMFDSHQTFFIQFQHENVRPEIWQYYERRFGEFCALPGVIDWWKKNNSQFIPDFIKYINAKIPKDV